MQTGTLFNKTSHPVKLEIVFGVSAVFVMLLMLITFQYYDTKVYEVWSVEFWDCFFSGNVKEYYAYTLLNPRGTFQNVACSESWIQMLPMILWDLPIWIFCHFEGQFVLNQPMYIIWHKGLFVVVTFIVAYYAYKICRLFVDYDKSLISVGIILASPEILLSTMYAGQDEIIYVCTFIITLYYYLVNDKKKIIIWSIITTCLNPLMLIAIVALMLIYEKRIYMLVIDITIMLLPLFLFNFVYRNDKVYSKSSYSNYLGNLFNNSISFKMNNDFSVPIFIILIIVVYFYCYSKKIEEIKSEGVIWLLSLLFILFNFFVGDEYINYFYRSFLYVPLVAILISISKQDITMNFFLLDVMTYFRTINCISMNGDQVLDTFYAMPNVIYNAVANKTGSNASDERIYLYGKITEKISLASNRGLIVAITIAVGAIIMYINYPNDNLQKVKLVSHKEAWIAIYLLCMPLFLAAYYVILF